MIARLRARLWRAWYRLRWLSLDRRRMGRIRVRRVAGMEVIVLPGVLDPAVFFSSEVLVSAVRGLIEPGSAVLDLGTGSGIGAVAAALAGARRVVATDVEQVAVRCCRVNVASHGLEQCVEVRHGDLFDAVAGERFDLVAFNPPYLLGVPADALGRALQAPPDLARRFAAGLRDHLAPGGSAVLVLSTNGDPLRFLEPLRAAGFATEALLERDRGSEIVTAWRITTSSPA